MDASGSLQKDSRLEMGIMILGSVSQDCHVAIRRGSDSFRDPRILGIPKGREAPSFGFRKKKNPNLRTPPAFSVLKANKLGVVNYLLLVATTASP